MSSSTAIASVGPRSDLQPMGGTANGTDEQYVTFTVGNEEYGVNILAVREIRGWTPESRLPNLPDYVRGVINLRGIIIPIFDLRARFGGGPTQVSKRHVVVVMQVGERTRGILVDAISDILAIGHEEIKPPPDVDNGLVDAEYLSGLYTAENRMVTLLSVDRLFAGEHGEPETALRAASAAAPAP
ncbi:chemotaxis protein CheW [Azospirillum picis]|uniref:Purine-binding chemotaxis protein CheW n=1 Tax=Azospirillum picis TaxID=488438 RepID=A0ABU0MKL1_9PROT|nr:chemotaxis protein CheW [Azospirillum picis]MBP2300151.1 purine-binding chemotaxis protein CheW [Azospirillum picis]MDQ0534007.1 purine-binding chemotaxis protein CheW [Azospirillum picis]